MKSLFDKNGLPVHYSVDKYVDEAVAHLEQAFMGLADAGYSPDEVQRYLSNDLALTRLIYERIDNPNF